jgi:hypothetical protein
MCLEVWLLVLLLPIGLCGDLGLAIRNTGYVYKATISGEVS